MKTANQQLRDLASKQKKSFKVTTYGNLWIIWFGKDRVVHTDLNESMDKMLEVQLNKQQERCQSNSGAVQEASNATL